MQLVIHPEVSTDLLEIADYYETAGGNMLAEDFYAEFSDAISAIVANPRAYPTEDAGLRRAVLFRFPLQYTFSNPGQFYRDINSSASSTQSFVWSRSDLILLLILSQFLQHREILERCDVARDLVAGGDLAQKPSHNFPRSRFRQHIGKADIVRFGE